MKKILFIFVLAAVIATGTAFADHPSNKLGIGIMGTWQGNWSGGWHGGPALSLKIPGFPVFWGVSLSFNQYYFGIGISGDYYFIERPIVDDVGLHWYLGVGGWVSFSATDNSGHFALGARLPVGLSWHAIDILEIFLEMAPSIGIQITPLNFPAGGWPISLGIRVWL